MPPPPVNKKLSDRRGRSRTGEGGDPDGTLSIARGLTRSSVAETKEHLLEGKSTEDIARIDTFLQGPHAHAAQERLATLQHDDQNEVTDSLREPQKRALAKRRKTHNKTVEHALELKEVKRLQAAVAAADAQIVLHTETPGLVQSEHDMERTWRLSQQELKNHHLDEQTARHVYDLSLTAHAPYGLEYDRSGRCALMYGARGHVSVMDCHLQSLVTEFHLPGERLRHATFLHNTSLMAIAQSNHVYIYDNRGAEIHKLQDHQDPFALSYLPHHWLLVSIGRAGWLKYHDTSTGELVSQHRTQQGASGILRHNPTNAVVHVGHKNGTVTLWSPASSQYLVKLQCHKGAPLTSMAVHDHFMVTGGADRQVKIWDLRMYKELHAYYSAGGIPTSIDISQRGLLGIGAGSHATVWSTLHTKQKDPYMYHAMPSCQVETLRFRPFEDVCGIGHNKGIASIVIPGSGEANLDTTEYGINPFADIKLQREQEVRSLMDKLNPSMISLDPDVVGTVEASNPHLRKERLAHMLEDKTEVLKKKQKSKKRGRSKIQTQLRRKAKNVVDAATEKLREAKKQEEAAAAIEEKGSNPNRNKDAIAKAPAALQRFFS